MNALTAFFVAAGEFLGLVRKRQELNNAPAMQAAKTAQQEADAASATVKAIAERDLEKLRQEASEP